MAKLRVFFTGLCAFIPNALPADRESVRMRVVLPDGRSTLRVKQQGTDGSPLRRHVGFLRLKLGQLAALKATAVPRGAEILWCFDRHRISFDYKSSTNRLRAGVLSADTEDFPEFLANMQSMVPSFAEIDPDIVHTDLAGKTVAQVSLDRGVLVDTKLRESLSSWLLPNLLTTPISIQRQVLSNEVALEVDYLDGVDIVASTYDGTEQARWRLTSVGGEDIEITISNLCDENPLRWETEVEEPSPEDDFRWYYTLLKDDSQTRIFQALGGLPFYVPQVPVNESGNGQGANCVPVGSSSMPIHG